MLAWIRAYVERHRTLLFSGVVGVISWICSQLYADFSEARKIHRETVKQSVEQVHSAQDELLKSLTRFADKATGRGSISSDDVNALRTNVQRAYATASRAVAVIPAAKPEFEQYSDALVKLQDSAQAFNGPADAKNFVEAASNYLFSKEKLNEATMKARTSWLASRLD